jgi:hypothetical protein
MTMSFEPDRPTDTSPVVASPAPRGVRYKQTITTSGSQKSPAGGTNVNTNQTIPNTGPVPTGFWRDPSTGQVIRLPAGQTAFNTRQSDVLAKVQYLEVGLKRLKKLREELNIGEAGMISGPVGKIKGASNIAKGALGIRSEPEEYSIISESLVTPIVKTILGDVAAITESDKQPARGMLPGNMTNDTITVHLFDYLQKILADRKRALSQGNFGPIEGANLIRPAKGTPTAPGVAPVDNSMDSDIVKELRDNGIDDDTINMLKESGGVQ